MPYSPKNIDSLKGYFSAVHKQYIGNFDKKYKNSIQKKLKNRDDFFSKRVLDSVYQFDKETSAYLNTVLNNIYQSNPKIKHNNFNFFLKNDLTANAGCYGNGIFEVNAGLFKLLESEDELAFILCHEIAHYNLKHSQKSIIKHIDIENSDEIKKQLDDVNSLRYGKNKALFKVLSAFNHKVLNHSKEAELEADSLGFYLFSKTNYKFDAAITSLQKLDTENDNDTKKNIQLDSIFNTKNYPFKNYWIEESKGLLSLNKQVNDYRDSNDTIKTHPAIPIRINRLKKLNLSKNKSKKLSTLNFEKIKIKQLGNLYQLTLDWKRYDLSIYLANSYLLNNLISKEEFTTKITSVFLHIYNLKNTHSLGNHIPLTSKLSKNKDLNKIRQFINSIELKELRQLGLNYCLENTYDNNPEYKFNLNQFKKLNKK